MGRNKEPKERTMSIEEAYGWPWKLSIDLEVAGKPQICFLSCKEREYFPEDPGYSRHGIEYSMNCHPGDTPNPSYVPSENRLQKPVSKKGYGIGGLSAPRFAKEHFLVTPEPGAYQKEISTPPKKTEKKKRPRNYFLYEEYRRPCEPLRPYVFGTSTKLARFPKEEKWQNVGVGHYNTQGVNKCKRLPVFTGFGRGEGHILAPTVTQCLPDTFNTCLECDFKLVRNDYYLSLRPIKLIYTDPSDPDTPKCTMEYVALCRQCYCKIMKEGHSFFTKDRLLSDFRKTRHCIAIHEHNDLPVTVHKVQCKVHNKLTRREALMAKYFTDACERTLREVVA